MCPEKLPKSTSGLETPLQLLLFKDNCSSTIKQTQQVRSYLTALRVDYSFDLQVINVGEQPYLAKHFKLVATPALVKIHPGPRQVIAGENLVTQLESCWPDWQQSVEDYLVTLAAQSNFPAIAESKSVISSVANSAELIELSDEIFHLKQEKAELQEQLRFKDRMIAIMAHDLRNPLTAALIALETLELGYVQNESSPRLTSEVMTRLMRHAHTQTRAIDQMITDLLQAAQSTSAEFHIQPKKLKLEKLCQEVLEHLQSRLSAKSQSAKTDIPNDLPYAYADENRVRQVIVSLLDNAAKYTPSEGLIQIAILHPTTQKLQVSVCDNGPGIPAESQQRIFEDQFWLERDKNQEGCGVGLALCRRIIQAHYGQIWVDSKLNQGSCFHFTLPVYRA